MTPDEKQAFVRAYCTTVDRMPLDVALDLLNKVLANDHTADCKTCFIDALIMWQESAKYQFEQRSPQ